MIGPAAEFSRRLLKWFEKYRRDLPWRLPHDNTWQKKLDPYLVLVSEAMLQQTQVATVIPYFQRFIALFPTVQSLADAEQQKVLRAWQGLGYYSRARNLQAAAKRIVSDFGGRVPSDVDQLLELPGIGRYTAGAISSIAFENRAPILDGNVARVLCRIDAIPQDPRSKETREVLWARAAEMLPQKNVGNFNSALMELGALICTPRSPQCLICPVQNNCSACAQGLQEKIPLPKATKVTPLFARWTFCVRAGDRYLVEQRPSTGRWAGMWQFATIEADDDEPTAALLRSRYSIRSTPPTLIGTVTHALTHRRYHFDVFYCQAKSTSAGQWLTLKELDLHPMPRPHLKIIELLKIDHP